MQIIPTNIIIKADNKKEKKTYRWMEAFEKAQDGVTHIANAFYGLDPPYEIKQALDKIDIYLTNMEDTIFVEDDE